MKNNNDNNILMTTNLSVGYKTNEREAVVTEAINLKLKLGELISLVGANGIGKSTLLKTLTKVQPSLSGTIFLEGKNLDSYSNLNLAKTLSLVLTEKIASKNLTVFELIALGRQPYTNWIGSLSESDLVAVQNAITKTNIEDLKTKKCFELSDGQLQKVMIARALAQSTNLIILDEPTTHLDMYHKAYILKLLQSLVKETGKTILFSSHEIDLAIQLCDTIIVMTESEVIQDTPNNLIKQGVFENLFPKDLVVFDKNSQSFKIKK